MKPSADEWKVGSSSFLCENHKIILLLSDLRVLGTLAADDDHDEKRTVEDSKSFKSGRHAMFFRM